jgi:hypothetical protein
VFPQISTGTDFLAKLLTWPDLVRAIDSSKKLVMSEGWLYEAARYVAHVAIGAALALLASCATRTDTRNTVEPIGAADPGTAQVRVVVPQGGPLDWCHKSDIVAFDRLGADGYFDVWLMNPDGSHQRPLTAHTPDLPSRHVGMPAWHPSCRYLAVQAQQPASPRQFDNKAVPGAGIFNDLWVVTADGSRAWKLVAVSGKMSKDAEGILHPHFSHDGRRLLWSQRVGAGKTSFGNWVLKLAEFEITPAGEPRLGTVRTLIPGGKPTFFESHGFSPDDRKIIYSGTPDVGMEIYTLDLVTGQVERLTDSPRAWDEHAQFSPDGRKIAWMSSEGLRFRVWPFDLQADFWWMNADGSGKQRLTYFHEKGHPHRLAEDFVVAADIAWSPDGKSLLALVVTRRPEDKERGSGPIVRITLP